jgi:hypothetical protein
VVEPPAASNAAAATHGYDVVAYPANGQSPEQVQQDGYECYRWAVQQAVSIRNATYPGPGGAGLPPGSGQLPEQSRLSGAVLRGAVQ